MNDIYQINEKLYPMGWRFNTEDCLLSSEEKKSIIMLGGDESEKLWDSIFPFKILMNINSSQCEIIEKRELDFEDVNSERPFFYDKLEACNEVIFFWGRRASAIITAPEIIVKAWDDFFYPSDESSLIYIPNFKKIIFSYEETFFFANVIK